MSNGSEVPEGMRKQMRRRRVTRWQAQFPYHWDADAHVTRRNLLGLAVQVSGALFAATAGIVGLGYIWPRQGHGQPRAIIAAAKVPPGGVHYFTYPTSEEQAILLHLENGNFVAYSGRCTHLSCAVYYDEQETHLVCPCHEGIFDPQTGEPVAGPPQRPLPTIEIRQDGGMIYAQEERPGHDE